MDLGDFVLRYVLIPTLTLIGTVTWYIYKKQDVKIDSLEQRINLLEKAYIESKTEFKFVSRDIREIKEILQILQKLNK